MKHCSEQDLKDEAAAVSIEMPRLDHLLRPAMESAGIGVWRFEVETGLGIWDAVTSRIFGWHPVDCLVPTRPPILREDRLAVAEKLARNGFTDREQDVEIRIVRPTGEIRWVRATGRASEDPLEQGRWLTGVVTDVTEKRNAEVIAEEAQRQLSTLMDNLPGLAYRCSVAAPWRMSFVSEGVRELTGFSPEEVMREGFVWADLIHHDDLPGVTEEVERCVLAGEMFSLTYRIINRCGETRWVLERGRAVKDAHGDYLFLEGFIGDITDQKRAEEEAVRASERLRSRLDRVPQMLWSVSADGTSAYYRNKRWHDFVGSGADGTRFTAWQEFIHPEDRERVAAAWAHSVSTGEEYEVEYRLRHHSGEFRWVSSKGSPQLDPQGHVLHWYGTCTDIHERVTAQEAVRTNEALTTGLVEASPDCLSLLDPQGTVLLVNAATLNCYGLRDESSLVGKPWGHRLPEEYHRTVKHLLSNAVAGHSGRSTVHVIDGRGDTRWWDMVVAPVRDERGHVVRVAVTSRDVTDQKSSEERAVWAATHDPLTLLPNRALLTERIDTLMEGQRRNTGFALLLVDVDNFKQINDTLGHDAGDALLCSLSARLNESVRPSDFVARLGGDEFAILLPGVRTPNDLQSALQRLSDAIAEPFIYHGRIMDTGASIGASLFPKDAATKANLLKNADVALYSAKAAGRGTWAAFAPEMRTEIQRQSSMLSLARNALANGWVTPYYQPKVELSTGRLSGFEALLRWKHPRSGLQTPDTIAAAFEDVVLARQITDTIIGGVIRDIGRWRDHGIHFGHVAVNAAAADFRRGDFADYLLEKLAAASVPPSCVQLEVTETVFLGRGAECVETALKTLSSAGVKIALDDFGTGYASLSHLKQFPVHIIKIDRSFVRGLHRDNGDAAIIDAVVNLGRSLNIEVVAEGVETGRQHNALLRLGCGYGQGYLYGRAKSAKGATALAEAASGGARLAA